MRKPQIVIVGAGASGVLLAIQLAQYASAYDITLIEQQATLAHGIAYHNPNDVQLLNVPARGMSAFPDQPDHFYQWLCQQQPEATPQGFASRRVYAEYLQHLLSSAYRTAQLNVITTQVLGLAQAQQQWLVYTPDQQIITADLVVLAVGNLLPEPTASFGLPPHHPRYYHHPWDYTYLDQIQPEEHIGIIGSGLTMIDVVLNLREAGHRGPISAISRHGWLPQSHAAYQPYQLSQAPPHTSPARLCRWVRQQLANAQAQGSDWRAVIDALRPYNQEIWRGWTAAQRASFYRHARALWDTHRHRAAPEVYQHIQELLATRQLQIHAGRVIQLQPVASQITIHWQTRDLQQPAKLHCDWVLNCTGTMTDYHQSTQPLIRQLREAGWLTPDPLRLGIETNQHGQLLGTSTQPVPNLFTLGPPRKATLWESTAIPEIRVQAAELAQYIDMQLSMVSYHR